MIKEVAILILVLILFLFYKDAIFGMAGGSECGENETKKDGVCHCNDGFEGTQDGKCVCENETEIPVDGKCECPPNHIKDDNDRCVPLAQAADVGDQAWIHCRGSSQGESKNNIDMLGHVWNCMEDFSKAEQQGRPKRYGNTADGRYVTAPSRKTHWSESSVLTYTSRGLEKVPKSGCDMCLSKPIGESNFAPSSCHSACARIGAIATEMYRTCTTDAEYYGGALSGYMITDENGEKKADDRLACNKIDGTVSKKKDMSGNYLVKNDETIITQKDLKELTKFKSGYCINPGYNTDNWVSNNTPFGHLEDPNDGRCCHCTEEDLSKLV